MAFMRMILPIVLGLTLLVINKVHGEVIEVTVTWNNIACNVSCAQLLEKRFKAMNQIEEVRVNPSSGIANLKWKPESPFSYSSVKSNMQMVGVGVNDIRVKVRGKARKQGRNVALFSIGDNTRFVLISPEIPQARRYTSLANPYLRELSPDLRESILREAQQDKIFVIEGTLYQPARSPPLHLIVERINIEKPEK